MDVEFYNAGNTIDERFSFSLPDGNDVHATGSWRFLAPKESFCLVPTEKELGLTTIHVGFVGDVRRRFGSRGVVQIDPKHDPATEDPDATLSKYPVAPNRELAVGRGKDLWLLFTKEIVDQHLADGQNAMAAGGAPRAAVGFTKHCLKIHGIQDPAERHFLSLKNGGGQAVSTDMRAFMEAQQKQSNLMMGVLMAIVSGQKVDPELLKASLSAPGTAGAIPTPVSTSGIATGEIKKPLGDSDNWDKAPVGEIKGKSERKETAIKELAKK